MAEFRDNPAEFQFELEIDGHTAVVGYRQRKDHIVLTHTEVPKELGGRGVGSDLAKRVLEALRAKGARVVVNCPFLTTWLTKHPEFDDILVSPPPRS